MKSTFCGCNVGAIPLRGRWTESALDTFLFSLNCSGSEDSVWECAHGSVNDGYTCDGTQDAAVICSGELQSANTRLHSFNALRIHTRTVMTVVQCMMQYMSKIY